MEPSWSGFWVAVAAVIIAMGGLLYSFAKGKNGAEIGFLKTRVVALEHDYETLKRENQRQQTHIDECEGKTRELQQEVMSLMRQLLSPDGLKNLKAP